MVLSKLLSRQEKGHDRVNDSLELMIKRTHIKL